MRECHKAAQTYSGITRAERSQGGYIMAIKGAITVFFYSALSIARSFTPFFLPTLYVVPGVFVFSIACSVMCFVHKGRTCCYFVSMDANKKTKKHTQCSITLLLLRSGTM